MLPWMFLLLSLVTCGKPFWKAPPAPAEAPFPRPVQAQEIMAISIERTPCFGTCPVYTYSFVRGGSAGYIGTRFVQDSGAKGVPMPGALFDSLAARVQQINFFRLPSTFSVGMTDLPSTIIRVTLPDTVKVVRRYGRPPETPPSLLALEALLDSTGARLFSHRPGNP
jgi:Domain of unknown function (DUF6438)